MAVCILPVGLPTVLAVFTKRSVAQKLMACDLHCKFKTFNHFLLKLSVIFILRAHMHTDILLQVEKSTFKS